MEKIFIHEISEILTINEEDINIEKLYNVFKKYPNRTVYVVNNESGRECKLVGIVTMGDFKRNQLKNQRLINRNFFKVKEGYELDAIKFLREKEKVTSIPVVNNEGVLVKEFYTNINKQKRSISQDIICQIVRETILLSVNYKKIAFIVTKYAKQLLEAFGENILILDDSMELELIKELGENKEIGIVDFCLESSEARRVFYEKYNMQYVIWDYESQKEVTEFLIERAKMYNSIGILDIKDNVLNSFAEKSKCDTQIIESDKLKWSEKEQCFELRVLNELRVECIFTLSCFTSNPYIIINGELVPILSLKYLQGLVVESRAVCADIAYNIIPRFKKFGVKVIVINTPRYEIGEIEEFFTEDISLREPSWSNMDAVTKFIGGDKQLAEELNFIMQPVIKNGFIQLPNFRGKYVNCIDSERYTCGNPQNSSNSVYLFGPCIVRGAYVEDRDTLGSILRKKISREYSIRNYGNTWITMNYLMRSKSYKFGDIVILFASDKDIYIRNDIKVYSIIDAYRKIPNVQNHVWDNLLHCDKLATRYVANEIYSICESENIFKKDENYEEVDEELFFCQKNNSILVPKQLRQWLSTIKKEKVNNAKKSGAIVMNCNPFTKGHRYLIEEAKKQVDVLYIFVVEEDKSFFKFDDRMKMVKLGVSDIDNVIVIPSGHYIISTQTLPGYFEKEKKPYADFDATEDLELFAGVIAKEMDISIRFAGEEPNDPFTRHYNLEMKRILPQYGIDFCEIKRIEKYGDVISASRVRKYMKENKYDKIKQLVIPKIYDYLEKYYF